MAEAPVPAQPDRGPAARRAATAGPAAPGPAAVGFGQRRRDLVITGLAMATGSLDAISFLGLGGVFTSVMTANMVLLGLSAGQRDGALALHAGVALAGFVAGGLAASRFSRAPAEPRQAEPRQAEPRQAEPRPAWPRRVNVALVVETAVLAAVTVGWEMAAARPRGYEQLVLVAAAAIAMGIQSAAVRALGVPGLSTTYLTGTLTTVLGDLAAARASAALRRRIAILVMLVVGAAVSGIAVWQAPRLAPVVPLGILIGVIVMATLDASALAAAPPEE